MRFFSSSLTVLLFASTSVAQPLRPITLPDVNSGQADSATPLSATIISRLSSVPTCYDLEYPNDWVAVYDGTDNSGFKAVALDHQGVLLGKAGALIPTNTGEEYMSPVAATFAKKNVTHIALGNTVSDLWLSKITARGRNGDLVGSNYYDAFVVSPNGEQRKIRKTAGQSSSVYDNVGDDGYAYGLKEMGVPGTPQQLIRARITDQAPTEEIIFPGSPSTWITWNASNRAGQRTGNHAPWDQKAFTAVLVDREGNYRELPRSIEVVYKANERGEFLTQEVDDKGFPIQALRRWDGSAVRMFRNTDSFPILTSVNSHGIMVGKEGYLSPVIRSAGGTLTKLASILCRPLREGMQLLSYADVSVNDQNQILVILIPSSGHPSQPVVLHPRYYNIQEVGTKRLASID